ncbi:uncharacterized protein TNCV_2091971 [Trichonephila clavipes]|nr:uncharacterized protein TNCV_2091971 [Trichonephila clavipes]
MTSTDRLFHDALSLCHTPPIALWLNLLSAHKYEFSMGARFRELLGQGSGRGPTSSNHWLKDPRTSIMHVQVTDKANKRFSCRISNGCPCHWIGLGSNADIKCLLIACVLLGPSHHGSFRSYYPYGLNVIWKGESVLLAFKQKSEDSLYIPNFDKSIDNSNNIRLARISRAKRRKRVTRDMSTLKNSMLELAVKFDDSYNTGLIKSFMFGM